MLSVFQIFKLLIGIIVFIFIMTFFLDITNMYSDIGGSQKEYAIADAFDKTARDVYTSGKSAQFSGFEDLDVLMYRPPALLFGSQKTLSVPLFMIPDKANMTLERRCDDYGWFRFCWILAYSDRGVILFSPLENTDETRQEMENFVNALPDAYSYGFCNGTYAKVSTKQTFIGFINGNMAASTFEECDIEPKDNMRIIVFNDSEPSEGTIVVSGRQAKEPASDGAKVVVFTNADIPALVTGGVDAVLYRQDAFGSELRAATRIMLERTKLVSQKMLVHNAQPCIECATPYPKACGWVDIDGQPYQSTLYNEFIVTLQSLGNAVGNGQYEDLLRQSVNDYENLREAGCEI